MLYLCQMPVFKLLNTDPELFGTRVGQIQYKANDGGSNMMTLLEMERGCIGPMYYPGGSLQLFTPHARP